jgi:hypothetical protein
MLKVKDKYKSYLQTRVGIDKYNAFKTILYSDKDTLAETLFNNYISKLKLAKAISICDVGGGDGKRIVDLEKKIYSQFHCNIHLDFIEQSNLMCTDFETKSHQLDNFSEIDIHSEEAEDFFLNTDYDIVFFIHSIFCFSDFSVLQKMFDRVKDGGVLYVVSNSSDSFLAKLKNTLDFGYQDKRYEIKDLISDLHLHQMHYSTDNFKTEWTLNNNEVDEKLSIILDWLSLGKFQFFETSRQKQLVSLAKKLSIKNENQFHFSEEEQVLTIRK